MTDSGTPPTPHDATLDARAEYLASGAVAEGHASDLQHLVGARFALEAESTWQSLPAELEDRVAAAIRSEQSGGIGDRRDPSRVSLRLLAAAAAVAVLLAFGAGWLVNSSRGSESQLDVAAAPTAAEVGEPTLVPTAVATAPATVVPTAIPTAVPTEVPTVVAVAPVDATVALSGTDFAQSAQAVALLRSTPSGIEIELSVTDLPPAPDDGYYQGWFLTTDDVLVTIGTFHLRGDDDGEPVVLWSGLDLEDVKMLMVTVQQLDGGPASSGVVALRGPLAAAE